MPVRKRGGRGEENEYDTHQVVRWLCDRAVRKAGVELPRDRLARVQADRAQLEVDELRGVMARTEDFVQRWAELITGWRAKLLAFPTKIAQRVAPPGKMADVQAEAQAVVYELLREFETDCVPQPGRAGGVAAGNDLVAAAAVDGQPVGGPAPAVEPRGQRRTGKVVNGYR